jgi:hypothetical protein
VPLRLVQGKPLAKELNLIGREKGFEPCPVDIQKAAVLIEGLKRHWRGLDHGPVPALTSFELPVRLEELEGRLVRLHENKLSGVLESARR